MTPKRTKDLRRERQIKRLCRQCGGPAKVDPNTGRVFSLCEKHLDADAERARNKK